MKHHLVRLIAAQPHGHKARLDHHGFELRASRVEIVADAQGVIEAKIWLPAVLLDVEINATTDLVQPVVLRTPKEATS